MQAEMIDSSSGSPPEGEIDLRVEEELLRHPGEWAAITPTEILAIGKDLAVVLRIAAREAARRQPKPEPILYHVPEAGSMYFF